MDKSVRQIPETLGERRHLRTLIQQFALTKGMTPPVSLESLRQLALEFIQEHQVAVVFKDWIMVEMHNCMWMPVVSSIPYDRRLLLLPKCLSHSSQCQGEMDATGLLCHNCGRCSIPSLQRRADEIGMLSMVAEGFTSVIELIENHVVDAVIGISCLDSLEKAFPLLVSHAVPGLAIPLNDDGCRDTHVDQGYVAELLPMHSDREISLIDYTRVRETVSSWFQKEELEQILSPMDDETSRAAADWLCGEGKRWRPFLLAATYSALMGGKSMPLEVRKAAVAVECFHKASLVHDDIQDQDTERYDKPTLNALYGDAIAINLGDYLLGEGYRLLSECGKPDLIRVISKAHLELCKGQGTELFWTASKTGKVSLDFVLDIFRRKTVPAFEMSIMLGLILADSYNGPLRSLLSRYSEHLGIAYQLQDDIEDAIQDNDLAIKPSAVMALETQHPQKSRAQILEEARMMEEEHHQSALGILSGMESLELKRLLFLVTEKILKTKK